MSKKKKGGSLQQQLKAAGLVTDKQIKKAQKHIHRQETRVRQGVEVDDTRLDAQKALAAKQEKDKRENRLLFEQAEEKALYAQVRQLISMHRQREKGDVEYNFSDHQKVKKIHISEKNKAELNRGLLAIVKHDEEYELVPEGVAQKIKQRLPDNYSQFVIYIYERVEVDEDDPYKDFPIPDDLDW